MGCPVQGLDDWDGFLPTQHILWILCLGGTCYFYVHVYWSAGSYDCMSWCSPWLSCCKKTQSEQSWKAWSQLLLMQYLSVKCPSELVQHTNKLDSLSCPLFGFLKNPISRFLDSAFHLFYCCLLVVMGDLWNIPQEKHWKQSKLKRVVAWLLQSLRASVLSHALSIFVFTGWSENSYQLELLSEKTLISFCTFKYFISMNYRVHTGL